MDEFAYNDKLTLHWFSRKREYFITGGYVFCLYHVGTKIKRTSRLLSSHLRLQGEPQVTCEPVHWGGRFPWLSASHTAALLQVCLYVSATTVDGATARTMVVWCLLVTWQVAHTDEQVYNTTQFHQQLHYTALNKLSKPYNVALKRKAFQMFHDDAHNTTSST